MVAFFPEVLQNYKRGHYALTALSPILSGRTEALKSLLLELDEADPSPFSRSIHTHMIRFAVIEKRTQPVVAPRPHIDLPEYEEPVGLASDYLLLAAVADATPPRTLGDRMRWTLGLDRGRDRYLEELRGCMQEPLERIYSHCVGFRGARTPEAFRRYIRRCQVHTTYFYQDYEETVSGVQRALDAQRIVRALAAKSLNTDDDHTLLRQYEVLMAPYRAMDRD